MVVLLNPPYYNQLNEREYEFPLRAVAHDLEIMYLKTNLTSINIETYVLDCPYEGICNLEINEHIEKSKIIVIFIHNHSNIFDVTKFTRRLKARYPQKCIICAGDYFSIDTKRYMTLMPEIDIGIVGEINPTLIELIQRFHNWENMTEVSNITYRRNGEVICNPRISYSYDLNNMPIYDLSCKNNKPANVIVSKGCNGNCSFCALNLYYKINKIGFQKRNPEDIWRDIDCIKYKCDADKKIIFQCDSFFAFKQNEGQDWLQEFVECARKRDYNVKFHMYARADELLKYSYFLDVLKTIGLIEIFMGIESFSNRQLELYSKGISADVNIQAYKTLQNKKIPFEIGMIIFEPTVTIEEVLQNYSTLRDLKYHEINNYGNRCLSLSSDLTLIKGTPLEIHLKSLGLTAKNKNGYVFKNTTTQELYKIKEKWCEVLSGVQSMDNLINHPEIQLNEIHYHNLLLHKKALLQIDIDFIITSCEKILSCGIVHDKIVNDYLDKLSKIEDVFIGYKKLYKLDKGGVWVE